jgi:ABC-type phosphate transport system substrate-binding protein
LKKQSVRILLCICLALTTLSFAKAEVVVVAHPDLGITSISSRDLREIFLGNRMRVGSSAVLPGILQSGDTHAAFLSAFIGRNETQFQTHWRNIVFTGRGRALLSFATEQELLDYVRSTSGAIGYINNQTPHEGLVVLTVQ